MGIHPLGVPAQDSPNLGRYPSPRRHGQRPGPTPPGCVAGSEPTRKYILHSEHGERERRVQKPCTKAKAVTSKVEIGQMDLLIEKMNSDKSVPESTMKFLSFNCEVAARREIFKCPGWRTFALDLGLKPMPEQEKKTSHCRLKLLSFWLIHLYKQNCLTFWGQSWVLACAVALGFR